MLGLLRSLIFRRVFCAYMYSTRERSSGILFILFAHREDIAADSLDARIRALLSRLFSPALFSTIYHADHLIWYAPAIAGTSMISTTLRGMVYFSILSCHSFSSFFFIFLFKEHRCSTCAHVRSTAINNHATRTFGYVRSVLSVSGRIIAIDV